MESALAKDRTEGRVEGIQLGKFVDKICRSGENDHGIRFTQGRPVRGGLFYVLYSLTVTVLLPGLQLRLSLTLQGDVMLEPS
ncbi:MAG: hypothetical protein GX256_07840 [Fretibacterium sp.]|nr:hypothetical protein [Fretibacterium sp.]